MAFFHVMKYDVKCGTCLHKFDCRETTLSNAANHLKIFLREFEICLYKHLYFLYIRNPPFPIAVFISMLWQLRVNMFYQKNSFPIIYKLRCCEFKGKQASKFESTSLCCISYTVLHVKDQKNEWSVFVE